MSRFSLILCSATLGLTTTALAQGIPENNEPANNDRAGAEIASPTGQCYGHLETMTADRDYWQFTINGPKRLTAWTSPRGSESTDNGGTATWDTVIEVYDSRGFFLAFNDDYEGSEFSLATADLPSAGTYYVAVATFQDPYIPTFAGGDYALDILCEDPFVPSYAPAGAESEPNDGCPSATLASAGEEHSNTLQSAGDSDFYAFTITSRSRLTWEVHSDNSTTGMAAMNPKVWLWDASCTQIAEDDDGGAGLMPKLVRTLDPGTYYIEVSDTMRNAMGDYRLTADAEIISMQETMPGSTGCVGTSGEVMELALRENERPRIGSTVTTDIKNLGSGACAVMLGTTAPPAPVDLTIIGAPNCALGINANLGSFQCRPAAPGEAEFGVQIGSVPFQGFKMFVQAAAIDIGANALGVILSPPVRWSFGDERF